MLCVFIYTILELDQARQIIDTITESCRYEPTFLVAKLNFYRPTGIPFSVDLLRDENSICLSGVTLIKYEHQI